MFATRLWVIGLGITGSIGGLAMADGQPSSASLNPGGVRPGAAVGKGQEPVAPGLKYSLPTDPETVVLALEYGGGMPLPRQAGFTPTPYVRVTAAGKVITGGSSLRSPVVELQLEPGELQALLSDLLERDSLFELKSDEIEAAIKETGQPIMIVDAPTTTISLRLADRDLKLKQYASRMIARQYAQVEQLQRFVSAEERLRRLQGLALLGGHNEMETMLAAVNEAIGAKSADLPTLDSTSLQHVNRDPQGKLSVTWLKEFPDGDKLRNFTVRVEVTPAGQRTISVGEVREFP